MCSLEVVKLCAAIIVTLSERKPLQEFEVLAYEQACKTVETLLKDFVRTWEMDADELESYQR